MGHNFIVIVAHTVPDKQITTHCQQEIAPINLREFSLTLNYMHSHLMCIVNIYVAIIHLVYNFLSLSLSLTQIQLAFTASEI